MRVSVDHFDAEEVDQEVKGSLLQDGPQIRQKIYRGALIFNILMGTKF